jgi:hypothetical protein
MVDVVFDLKQEQLCSNSNKAIEIMTGDCPK